MTRSFPFLALFAASIAISAAAAEAKPKANTAPPPAEAASAEKSKPGFFKRLFGSKRDSEAKPGAPTPPKVAASQSAPQPPLKKPAAEEKKPGFFKRLLGKGETEAKSSEETAKAELKKEPKLPKSAGKPEIAQIDTKAKPPAGPALKADKDKPVEKKPGFFARLFGGGGGDAASGKDGSVKPPRPADWESKHVVCEDEAAIYAYGPSQATGADEHLPKGTILTMKEAGKSWSRVALENGKTYVIGTVQIRKAKESDFSEPERSVAAAPPGSSEYFEPLPAPNLPDAQGVNPLPSGDLLIPLGPLPPP